MIGPQPALDAIAYLYRYLTQEIERLADAAYLDEHVECVASGVTPPSARSWKNAFRNGASLKIAERIREQHRATTARARAAAASAPGIRGMAATTALAIVDRQAVACMDYARKEAPHLFRKDGKMRGGTSVSVGASSTGFAAGRSAGASVNLGGNRGLSAGGSRGSLK